jgi:hypothetical protein
MNAVPVPPATVAVEGVWMLCTVFPNRTLHGVAAEQLAPIVKTVGLLSVTASADNVPLVAFGVCGSHWVVDAFQERTCPSAGDVAATGRL